MIYEAAANRGISLAIRKGAIDAIEQYWINGTAVPGTFFEIPTESAYAEMKNKTK